MNEKNEEEYLVKIIYDQDGERILTEFWYNEKKQSHRLGDLPAITHYDYEGEALDQHWMVNGKYHRTGNPAMIVTDPKSGTTSYQWKCQGKLHREDGQPAFIITNGEGITIKQEWYINGQRLTKAGLVYKGPN